MGIVTIVARRYQNPIRAGTKMKHSEKVGY